MSFGAPLAATQLTARESVLFGYFLLRCANNVIGLKLRCFSAELNFVSARCGQVPTSHTYVWMVWKRNFKVSHNSQRDTT